MRKASVLVFFAFSLKAQTLAFEVASVKSHVETNAERQGMGVRASGTEIHGRRMTLAALIAYAYSRPSYEISGGPSWVEKDQFDIDARAPGNEEPSRDDIREMMRALLTERFNLKSHEETRSMPVFALILSKKGLKMKPGQPSAPQKYMLSGGRMTLIQSTNSPLQLLVNSLLYSAGRPILDQTGLTGGFDYKLEFSPSSQPDPVGLSLFSALEEQLGLKLEPAKAPVSVLVIDEAAHPSRN